MAHSPRFEALCAATRARIQELDLAQWQARAAGPHPPRLIDLREDHEWAQGHIPGAEHLGRGILERDVEARYPALDTELVLYCGGGFRSALAAESLQNMGYTRVWSLAGGWKAWKAQGGAVAHPEVPAVEAPGPRLYGELAGRYSLLTPREDYPEEAAVYEGLLRGVLGPGQATLLELGAGAGHTASWLRGFALTLSDLSPAMLALAQANNPTARCVPGDMRTLRLNTTFDAVFAHDALAYLRTREDLRAALQTAWEHLRPGGALLLAPDYVSETFTPSADCGGSDGEGEAVRYLEWCWQRPGEPEGLVVDYVIVHRAGTAPATAAVDRHEEGLFPRAVWLGLLQERGFEVLPCPDAGLGNVLFLARRPLG